MEQNHLFDPLSVNGFSQVMLYWKANNTRKQNLISLSINLTNCCNIFVTYDCKSEMRIFNFLKNISFANISPFSDSQCQGLFLKMLTCRMLTKIKFVHLFFIKANSIKNTEGKGVPRNLFPHPLGHFRHPLKISLPPPGRNPESVPDISLFLSQDRVNNTMT